MVDLLQILRSQGLKNLHLLHFWSPAQRLYRLSPLLGLSSVQIQHRPYVNLHAFHPKAPLQVCRCHHHLQMQNLKVNLVKNLAKNLAKKASFVSSEQGVFMSSLFSLQMLSFFSALFLLSGFLSRPRFLTAFLQFHPASYFWFNSEDIHHSPPKITSVVHHCSRAFSDLPPSFFTLSSYHWYCLFTIF